MDSAAQMWQREAGEWKRRFDQEKAAYRSLLEDNKRLRVTTKDARARDGMAKEINRLRAENERLRGALRAVPLLDHTIDALADGSADGWIDMDDVQHTVALT